MPNHKLIDKKLYSTALTNFYYAVCLDIDGTITPENSNEKKKILKSISKLMLRYIPICFITGRGKNSSLIFLNKFKIELLDFNKELKPHHFNQWYLSTHNGAFLFSNIFNDCKEEILFQEDVINQYYKLKPSIQNTIAQLLSKEIKIKKEEIIQLSNNCSGKNSLRFPIDKENIIKLDFLKELESKINSLANLKIIITKSFYKETNQYIIEASIATKDIAVKKISKTLDIPIQNILIIGDQGGEFSNDFHMLNCINGFSVKDLSSSPTGCWPIKHDSAILYGVNATSYLLENLKILPNFYIKSNNKKSIYKLALCESLSKTFHKKLNEYPLEYENYIDKKTGGFLIYEYEYLLLKASNPEHFLFKIFDITDLSKKNKQHPYLKYALKNDDGLLLRGPFNYYNNLAFKSDNKKDVKKFALRFIDQRYDFFKICLKELQKYNKKNSLESTTSQKTLLGILDSSRDFLLISLNILLEKHMKNKNYLYIVNNQHKNIDSLHETLKKNSLLIYNTLFNKKYITPNTVSIFLEKSIIPTLDTIRQLLKKDDENKLSKEIRTWREIDSFYENVITLKTAIQQINSSQHIKKLLLCGIKYGSLELPVLLSIVLGQNHKYNFCYIKINKKYAETHSKTTNDRIQSKTNINAPNSKLILLDDNLLTGKTLQIAHNILANHNIYPSKTIIIRYPSTNRINHMLLPGHGIPNTHLFWKYIYGLSSPSPYTRLEFSELYKRGENPYLNKLGCFDKTRIHVTELLFLNGIFTKNSEVKHKIGDRIK